MLTSVVVIVVLAAVAGAFTSGWRAGAGRTRRKIAEAQVKVRDAQIEVEQNRPTTAAAVADRLRDGQ